MTAKEFLIDYMLNHPEMINGEGQPYFNSLEKMIDEIYDPEYNKELSSSRWWYNIFCVQKINNRLIGFKWAYSSGDNSPQELGWEFDEDSICFVEPYTETVVTTKYKIIDNDSNN